MLRYELVNTRDVSEFVSLINKCRLANKGKWYCLTGYINGKYIEIKAFGTWMQICRVQGMHNANCPDLPVGRFKEQLTNLFTEVIYA